MGEWVVELGGIEPPSVEGRPSVLRPFPDRRLYGYRTAGSAGPEPDRRVFPRCQRSFPPSAVFPAVTHRFCCRAAVSRPRVPLLVAVSLYHLSRSGSESELAVGGSFCCPV